MDLYVAIEDALAESAMGALADIGVVAGESGAAGLAGLLQILTGSRASEFRGVLGVDSSTEVVLLSTEGATDPIAYTQIVGRPPEQVTQA